MNYVSNIENVDDNNMIKSLQPSFNISYNFFLLYKKSKDSSATFYHKKTKKGFKKACKRYQDLSEGDKYQKQLNGSKPCKNLPKDEKQRLDKYRKNIKYGKTKNTSQIKTK